MTLDKLIASHGMTLHNALVHSATKCYAVALGCCEGCVKALRLYNHNYIAYLNLQPWWMEWYHAFGWQLMSCFLYISKIQITTGRGTNWRSYFVISEWKKLMSMHETWSNRFVIRCVLWTNFSLVEWRACTSLINLDLLYDGFASSGAQILVIWSCPDQSCLAGYSLNTAQWLAMPEHSADQKTSCSKMDDSSCI